MVASINLISPPLRLFNKGTNPQKTIDVAKKNLNCIHWIKPGKIMKKLQKIFSFISSFFILLCIKNIEINITIDTIP